MTAPAALGLAVAAAMLASPARAAAPGLPPFGLGAFASDEPIVITADELEARDADGRRQIAFRHKVEVRQGSLRLSAEVLEAVYVAGESQPEHLSARGRVVIREGTRRAHCEDAQYDRRARKIVCRGGPAELWDDADRLAGRTIAFDLAAQNVRVEGDAEVQLHRDLGELDLAEQPDPEVMERLRGKGPVTIRSDALEASSGTERRIHFTGHVVLRQGEIELRAEDLEALYPPGASQPDRLVARRDVVLTEAAREARCQRAEYSIAARRITCEGEAILRDRNDRLQGDRIAFDFGSRQVDAVGGAKLVVESTRRKEAQP